MEGPGSSIHSRQARQARQARPARSARLARLAVAALVILTNQCAGTTTAPQDAPLTVGRWSGGGACLSVTTDTCDFVAGCGHGQFPRPTVHANGFAVQGTYRIEVGPISITPPPPAMFNGLLDHGVLTVMVTPSDPSIPPFSAVLQLTNGANACSVPCV